MVRKIAAKRRSNNHDICRGHRNGNRTDRTSAVLLTKRRTLFSNRSGNPVGPPARRCMMKPAL